MAKNRKKKWLPERRISDSASAAHLALIVMFGCSRCGRRLVHFDSSGVPHPEKGTCIAEQEPFCKLCRHHIEQ